MARGDKDGNPMRRHSEEFNAWMASLEALDVDQLKEYARQYKDVLSSQMKAEIRKLILKKQPKKRKKRTAVNPILGAVLKFHRDDTPPPGSAGANAC